MKPPASKDRCALWAGRACKSHLVCNPHAGGIPGCSLLARSRPPTSKPQRSQRSGLPELGIRRGWETSRETARSTSPRLFLLPLSILLFPPGKPLSSVKALLAAHSDLETGTCCRLVDTSCNNTLKTTASGRRVLTRAGALEMTPHLQKCPRAGHQKRFKKEAPFTKQISRDGRSKEVLLILLKHKKSSH